MSNAMNTAHDFDVGQRALNYYQMKSNGNKISATTWLAGVGLGLLVALIILVVVLLCTRNNKGSVDCCEYLMKNKDSDK